MKKICLSLIALAAAAFANVASAQSQGYVGLQVGTSRSDIDCSGTTSCDKNDTGFKVFGGYKLTPEWAIELGYSDLGKTKFSTGAVTGSVATTSLGLGVAYHLAFGNDWTGVARLGVASNQVKLSGTVNGLGSASDSKRKAEPYLGLGVGYALTKQVSLTGNWDWTQGEYSNAGGSIKPKYNVFSLGVNFAF